MLRVVSMFDISDQCICGVVTPHSFHLAGFMSTDAV